MNRPTRPGTDNSYTRALLDEADDAALAPDPDEAVELLCEVRQRAERLFADGAIEGADKVDVIDYAADLAAWLGAERFSKVSHAPDEVIRARIALATKGRRIGLHMLAQHALRRAEFAPMVETMGQMDRRDTTAGEGFVWLRSIYPAAPKGARS